MKRIDSATAIMKVGELYDPQFNIEICLNDGSGYPKLMKLIRGQAFGWGFYDIVVLQGRANSDSNYVELNGYKWNLTQLIAHEATHCLQYHQFGFWKTNPVDNIPVWKFEGYPEYVARQNPDQKDLSYNITRSIETEKKDNNGWVNFNDGTGTVIPYYKSWLLVQYCMDIKKMSYSQILKDADTEETINKQMMNWYRYKISK